MCRRVTSRLVAVMAGVLSLAISLHAQTEPSEWRHIGNAAFDLGLSSVATGPVDRVWYSEDGLRLFARTRSGKTFETEDFERWRSLANPLDPPVEQSAPAISAPEPAAKIRQASRSRMYGLGLAAYRSEDSGVSWSNLTQYRGSSLLGSGLSDLAVSPRDPDELAVAGAGGVWRSADGGLSWSGLNLFLPNLPVSRILALPSGTRGLRILLGTPGASELEWVPGEKLTWRIVDNADVSQEASVKSALSRAFGVSVTAFGVSGTYLYAGSAEGQLWSSADKGWSWSAPSDRLAAPVESIFVNPKDPRIAVAALGRRDAANVQTKAAHVLRTMNGGIFWDDMTASLPDSAAHGVTADPTGGAIYVATDAGVFMTVTDLARAGTPTSWLSIGEKLPRAAAADVKLDAGGNQLFVALEGLGVYATIAPHRIRDIRVVNAADFSSRATAPGGLLSVIGARVQSAQTNSTAAPVLAASDLASQIQVPFDAQGSSVALSINAASGRYSMGFALRSASPAIFVDPDGSPLVLDSDSGVLLDSSKPARPKSRVQILATGLGRVRPDYPAGVAAPLNDPPRVVAQVKVYMDRIPLEVTQAILAPGYIGYYLIEAEIPAIVNQGSAELYVEVEGQASNPVRLYLAQ